VGKDVQDIILGIRLLRLLDRVDGLSQIAPDHWVKEGLVRLAAALDVQLLEEIATGASRHARPEHVREREAHLGGDGKVRRGPDLGAVVAQVAAHHDECVGLGCRPGESGEVADGVAW